MSVVKEISVALNSAETGAPVPLDLIEAMEKFRSDYSDGEFVCALCYHLFVIFGEAAGERADLLRAINALITVGYKPITLEGQSKDT